jgi:hypothetical protein
MLKQAPAWLITYWKNRGQMFFESMHCLFFDDRQQTTRKTTEEDNHLHQGTYHQPRGRTNKPTTEQQREAKGRGKAG